jgi:hypothetical protein
MVFFYADQEVGIQERIIRFRVIETLIMVSCQENKWITLENLLQQLMYYMINV